MSYIVSAQDIKKTNKMNSGNIIVFLKEPGKLFINGIFIGKVKKGNNKIEEIPFGKNKVEVQYINFVETYIINIEDNNSTDTIYFNYVKNKNIKQTPKLVDYQYEEISDKERNILDQAYNLLGKPPNSLVVVKGKRFILDCVGTVSAIFYAVDIDLQRMYSPYSGNGVTCLYKLVKANQVLNENKLPEVGDIIFWDNTYDRNNDKKFGNDLFTHVGIVTKTDDDGTIHYIHQHIRYGVVVEKMNLYKPKERYDETGKEINSPMHSQSGYNLKNDLPYLSGELWRINGGVLKITEKK